ncbi:MAG: neutral zinc metallopeptidase [Xanthobacteraceae bacterium]
MRIDDLPRSENIDDRRGIRVSRGGIGIGTIVVLGLIGWALGIDPRLLIGGAEVLTRGQQSDSPSYSDTTTKQGQGSNDEMKQFVAAVLGSTEVQWTEVFNQANARYRPPTLVMFSEATQSACGFAQAAMGPFYCPKDQQVYLDTSFFEDLQRRFGACDPGKACQFSQAYVIAHEIGHHVQNLLGILPRLQRAQQGVDRADANRLQVMAELQADCFAGVWANRSQQKWKFLDPGDVETALQTASAIGDDRLQRRSQGYVVPDAFTHGSSQQRMRWFSTGLKTGDVAACDTFNAAQL